MNPPDKDPVTAASPTMCVVCAWRLDCKKKYSYEQGSIIKCADFTRDATKPAQEEPDK